MGSVRVHWGLEWGMRQVLLPGKQGQDMEKSQQGRKCGATVREDSGQEKRIYIYIGQNIKWPNKWTELDMDWAESDWEREKERERLGGLFWDEEGCNTDPHGWLDLAIFQNQCNCSLGSVSGRTLTWACSSKYLTETQQWSRVAATSNSEWRWF